jgi:hypothetical protein
VNAPQHTAQCDELHREAYNLGADWYNAADFEDQRDIGRTIGAVQREIYDLHLSGDCPGGAS